MKKYLLTLGLIILLLPCNANAMTSVNSTDYLIQSISSELISPLSDETEIRFRNYNGKIQYRRWSITNTCWIDPTWKDL